jgi:signal transduction histidine kinase
LDIADRYTKSRKAITQNKRYVNSTLVVRVEDNGPGIDPEVFSKLFVKFVSKSYHGTGLGLFISKSIIEAHSGRIWAENKINGSGGAALSFTIPVSKDGKDSFHEYELQKLQLGRQLDSNR